MLTDDDLGAIRERVRDPALRTLRFMGPLVYDSTANPRPDAILAMPGQWTVWTTKATVDVLIALPEDVPALLTEVERLREHIEGALVAFRDGSKQVPARSILPVWDAVDWLERALNGEGEAAE